MRRLLLVEDDARLRRMVCEALEDARWIVTSAESGDEAKRILDTGATFEALVTDVRMPGKIDGISLARHVHRADRDTKVVVISGFLGTERNPVVVEGLGSFLAKPFTIRQLEAQLEAA